MLRFCRTIVFVLCMICVATITQAQWRSLNTGMTGASVGSFCEHNGVVFLGAGSYGDGSVYRSTDRGSSWMHAGVKLGATPVLASTASNVLASYQGLWLSADNGQSWMSRGLDTVSFLQMFVLGDTVIGTTYYGLYLSTNQGMSWQQRQNVGTPSHAFQSLTLLGSIVFGISSDGLYRTTDLGETWESVPSQDLSDLFIPQIRTISDTLVITTFDNKFLYSADSAMTWFSSKIPSACYSLTKHDSLLVAGTMTGLCVSTDFGTTWSKRMGGRRVPSFVYMIWLHDSLLVGNHSGVYRSLDHGYSWTPCNQGLEGTTVTSLFSRGTNLYAGTAANGAYHSTNAGTRWESMADDVNFDYGIPCIIGIEDTVLCGTQSTRTLASSDRGQSWKRPIDAAPGARASAFGDGYMYLSSATSGSGIFVSSDNGSRWTRNSVGLAPTVSAVDISVNGSSVAIADYNGPFVSNDRGAHWSSASSGAEGLRATSITIQGSEVWMGTDTSGLYYSSDNGHTWNAKNTGILNKRIFKVRRSGKILFAFANSYFQQSSRKNILNDVYASGNNGESWVSVVGDLSRAAFSAAEVFDQKVYVGLSSSGLLVADVKDFAITVDVPEEQTPLSEVANLAYHRTVPTSLVFPECVTHEVRLFNAQGRQVKRWTPNDLASTKLLDLSDTETGVYVLVSGSIARSILLY